MHTFIELVISGFRVTQRIILLNLNLQADELCQPNAFYCQNLIYFDQTLNLI